MECFLFWWIRNIYKRRPSHTLQHDSQKQNRSWGAEEAFSSEGSQRRLYKAHMDVTLFICEYSHTNINTLQSLPVLMTPSASRESKLYSKIVLSGRHCRFLISHSTWNIIIRVATRRKSFCKGNHLTNVHHFITTQTIVGVLVLTGCSLNIGSDVNIPLRKKF